MAEPMSSAPPPRSCFESEPEVQVPDRVDHLFVTPSRAAREALEEGQHRVRGVVELDHGVAALEVALLRLGRPLSILHSRTPLAAPRTEDVDRVRQLFAFRRLLIHRVLPEHESEWQDQTGRSLVDCREL